MEERSNQLIEVSTNQRVECHPGGTLVSACADLGVDSRLCAVKVTLFLLKSFGEISSGLG